MPLNLTLDPGNRYPSSVNHVAFFFLQLSYTSQEGCPVVLRIPGAQQATMLKLVKQLCFATTAEIAMLPSLWSIFEVNCAGSLSS